MDINEIIIERKLTRYRLSKDSGIPYTTVSDICNGKAQLEKCSAETVYRLAKALRISMELLLEDSCGRSSFDLFKSNICHRVKEMGDTEFIIEILEKNEIRTYQKRKWFPECFYLLAMLDYLSRENNVPLCTDYDDLRTGKLEEPVYPTSVLAIAAAEGNDRIKERARQDAIPEFIRFNIVESEVRNVV